LRFGHILNKRYEECSKEHLKPADEICHHCYRHLDDKINGNIFHRKRLNQLEIRRTNDLIYGIRMLVGEERYNVNGKED